MNKLHTVKITKITKHPNATRLNICEVTDGETITQVVCGASNAEENLITILAPVGSKTPNGLEIKKTDLRGVESNGMLCSAKDLGISNEKGIIDLPIETQLNLELSSLDHKALSSTPWYKFQKIEELRLNDKNQIQVIRDSFEKASGQLISETYFTNGSYRYRNY